MKRVKLCPSCYDYYDPDDAPLPRVNTCEPCYAKRLEEHLQKMRARAELRRKLRRGKELRRKPK